MGNSAERPPTRRSTEPAHQPEQRRLARQADDEAGDRAGDQTGGQTGGRPSGQRGDRTGDQPIQEYRAAELAQAAGITSRTLRFYRERKLLPPPRRAGRIAWYNEHHLARLRTIGALLARGHTLGGIADLLTAFEQGRDDHSAAAQLGLESPMGGPWSQETPVRLTPEDLTDRFEGHVTADDLAAALDLGYVTVDGDQLVHASRRLLEVSAALVREGVPLAAVLDAGREVRVHADAIASLFAALVRTHVLGEVLDRTDENREAGQGGTPLPAKDVQRIAETLSRLRPLSQQVIDAELSMAMERQVRTALAEWLAVPAPDAHRQDAHRQDVSGQDVPDQDAPSHLAGRPAADHPDEPG